MMISLLRHPATDVALRLVGIGIALLDLEGHLVGAAMLGAAQRADRAGDGGIDVRPGAGDHPGGERGGVEFVLRVQNQRGMHRLAPRIALGGRAVQQMQEMRADGVIVRLDLDAPAVVA